MYSHIQIYCCYFDCNVILPNILLYCMSNNNITVSTITEKWKYVVFGFYVIFKMSMLCKLCLINPFIAITFSYHKNLVHICTSDIEVVNLPLRPLCITNGDSLIVDDKCHVITFSHHNVNVVWWESNIRQFFDCQHIYYW